MAKVVRILRNIIVGYALFAGIGALAFFTLTGRLPTVEAERIDLSVHPAFRTWDEHDTVYGRGNFPYVVVLEGDRGALLLIGVRHSSNPDDQQWDVVREVWKTFTPTVALNEGRSRYFRWSSTALGGISDPKLAYVLARGDGIPIYSLEPTYQVEVDALLEKWPAELVASYLSLRVISAESGGDPDRAESIAPGLIAKRTSADGLRDSISSVGDLDAVWARNVPEGPDWRSLTNTDSVELLRRIGDDSREVRGRHMVRSLATLAGRGERVVAVVGASHAIRYEPTLRSLLGAPH